MHDSSSWSVRLFGNTSGVRPRPAAGTLSAHTPRGRRPYRNCAIMCWLRTTRRNLESLFCENSRAHWHWARPVSIRYHSPSDCACAEASCVFSNQNSHPQEVVSLVTSACSNFAASGMHSNWAEFPTETTSYCKPKLNFEKFERT